MDGRKRQEREREREREIVMWERNQWVASCMHPDQGSNPQPWCMDNIPLSQLARADFTLDLIDLKTPLKIIYLKISITNQESMPSLTTNNCSWLGQNFYFNV